MKIPALTLLFLAVNLVGTLSLSAQIELSSREKAALGKKIWQNECGGTVAGLTSWNSGEDFGSFGIGHFIWYPPGKRGPFEESFPPLIQFLTRQGSPPPAFVAKAKGCPWATRTEFERAKASREMQALREYLAATVTGQTEYLIARFNAAVPKLLGAVPKSDRAELAGRLRAVGSSSRGAFALVDYVNFKGEGLAPAERYQGEGWGLLQVLEAMNGQGDPVEDFSRAAARVLTRRVENSPPARNEKKWLAGWLNRVGRY